MGKTVVYSVEGGVVKGEFDAGPGDTVLLLGKTHHAVHAWRNGVDACNLIGSPCPLQPMTGYTIPYNDFADGVYSIGIEAPAARPGPILSNGELVVGSGQPDELRSRRDPRRE